MQITDRLIKILPGCASIVIAVVFSVSATDKLVNYGEFQNALLTLGFIPNSLVPAIALAVIVSEFWISIGLLIRRTRPTALTASLSMLGAFILVLSIGLLRGTVSHCGCGGIISQRSIPDQIVQDMTLFALGACGLYILKSQPTCPRER